MLMGIRNLVKHMLVKNSLVVTRILHMFKLYNKRIQNRLFKFRLQITQLSNFQKTNK
jgi:hypothetical protein